MIIRDSQRDSGQAAAHGAVAREAVAAFLEIEPSVVRNLPRSSVQAPCALIEVKSNSGVPNTVAGLHEELVQLRFAARISDDLARRDHLTRLGNRRALDERLELEIARARRYGRDRSVVLVDVDNLKRVNGPETSADAVADLTSKIMAMVAAPVRN